MRCAHSFRVGVVSGWLVLSISPNRRQVDRRPRGQVHARGADRDQHRQQQKRWPVWQLATKYTGVLWIIYFDAISVPQL